MSDDQADNSKLHSKGSAPVDVELSDLIAYLDGELDDSSVDAIERRLVDDVPLRRSAESLDRTWQLLDSLEEAQASGEFTLRTLATIAAADSSVDLTEPQASPENQQLSSRIVWWRQPLVLFMICFVCSGLGLSVARWRNASLSPEADVRILENLDVLRGYNQYRWIPNVEFLEQLRTPQAGRSAVIEPRPEEKP